MISWLGYTKKERERQKDKEIRSKKPFHHPLDSCFPLKKKGLLLFPNGVCLFNHTSKSSRLSSHADHTGMHQLLDLGSDLRVLQVLLQRRRIFLGLLQDGLHNGVLQDTDNLTFQSVNQFMRYSELQKNSPLGRAGYAPSSPAQSHPHAQSTVLVGPWSLAVESHACACPPCRAP